MSCSVWSYAKSCTRTFSVRRKWSRCMLFLYICMKNFWWFSLLQNDLWEAPLICWLDYVLLPCFIYIRFTSKEDNIRFPLERSEVVDEDCWMSALQRYGKCVAGLRERLGHDLFFLLQSRHKLLSAVSLSFNLTERPIL